MLVAPLPDNEEERLRQLYELTVLDTLEEQEFDDLTCLAAQICTVPYALISLVDRDRQFFKSHQGLDIKETPRDIGFCPHAILKDEITIVEDTTQDERFFDNPVVTDGLKIRFYAGAPLSFANNIRIGTICIVDTVPRTLSEEQQQALRALSRQVVALLELKQSIKKQVIADKERNDAMKRLILSEKREHARSVVLEMLAKDDSLETVLNALVLSIEAEMEGAHCSILLLDEEGSRLLHGAAPNLPSFYNEAIHGIEIGIGVGSCGTAAYTGKRVVVEDVHNHSYWAAFTELTYKANLAACWSEPVLDSIGNVLGTFAIYYSEPRAPDDNGISVIESAAKLAGIAIQRKRKEKLLIKTRKLAEEANRAKSDFISTMSHELRTPLTSILGALGLVIGNATGSISKNTKGMLEMAYRNSERLMRLINDLLDISKIEAGKLDVKLEKHELNGLLSQSVEINQAYAIQKGIKLNLQLSNEKLYAMVDVGFFEQVVANLISNAVKFSDESETVDISLVGMEASARLTVEDYGMGIAKEFQPQLFEKFTQQDASDSRQRGGTGLGLAISRHLVTSMGGTIDLESEPGKGSKFYFDLPVIEGVAINRT